MKKADIVKKYIDELKKELLERPDGISKKEKLYISQTELIRFINEFTDEYFKKPACFMMPDWKTKKDVLMGIENYITTEELSKAMLKTIRSGNYSFRTNPYPHG